LSGAEGAPARGGGGRARGLARRQARANEKERGSRGAGPYGGVVLGAALGVVDDGEQGRQQRQGRQRDVDEEDGAAAGRARSTRAWWRRRKKGSALFRAGHL